MKINIKLGVTILAFFSLLSSQFSYAADGDNELQVSCHKSGPLNRYGREYALLSGGVTGGSCYDESKKGVISFNKYGYYLTESMMASVAGNNWDTSFNRGEARFENGGLKDIYGVSQGTEDGLYSEATFLQTGVDDEAEIKFFSENGQYWFSIDIQHSDYYRTSVFTENNTKWELSIKAVARDWSKKVTVYRYPVDIPLSSEASNYVNYIKEKPDRVSEGTATRSMELYVNNALIYTASNIKHINNTISPADLNVSTKQNYVLDHIDASGSTYKVYVRAVKYYVDFYGNGNTGGSMSREEFSYYQEKALTLNTFIRNGYSFVGWNTKADGTGTPYNDGQTIINLSSTDGDVINLYAQWEPEKADITITISGLAEGDTIMLKIKKDDVILYTVPITGKASGSSSVTIKDLPTGSGYSVSPVQGWNFAYDQVNFVDTFGLSSSGASLSYTVKKKTSVKKYDEKSEVNWKL